MRPRRRRAFTLVELSAAMAISGLIGAAALMVFNNISTTRTRLGRMTIADDNGKVLGHYLEREAQRVGGSRLRPWQSIGIEDENGNTTAPVDCSSGGLPCVTGDRLTFAFAVAGFVPESCSIDKLTSSDGMNSGTIRFKKEFDVGSAGGKVCCIEVRQGEEGAFNAPPENLVNTHAIISSGIKHFGLTFAAHIGECQFRWVRSGQVKALSSGAVSVSDFDRIEGVPANQVTGFAVPVDVATFFVGCADDSGCKCPDTGCTVDDHPEQRALMLFSDRNAASAPPGTIVVEADDRMELITAGVLDFQVSILADIDGDGSVDEVSPPASDEVFGNAKEDSTFVGGRTVWLGGGSQLNLTGKMRGMRFEVITGVMTHDPSFPPEPARQISIARGVPLQKPGMHVRRTSVGAAFRNLNILK